MMGWRRDRRPRRTRARDRAIANADDALHEAVRHLRWASHLSCDMGDPRFADELWRIADEIPHVSRQVAAYLYDYAERLQAPRVWPITSVRKLDS